MTSLFYALPPWRLLLILSICELLAFAQSPNLKLIQTDFSGGPELNQSEILTVLQLARRCGIRQVAQVKTYHIHPTPNFDILVTSPETIRGREVSYMAVHVTKKQWSSRRSETNLSLPATYPTISDFWVEPEGVCTNRLTLFALTNRTVRIELKGVPVPMADRMVEAFTKGRVRFSDTMQPLLFKDLDLATATSIGVISDRDPHYREGTYVITFTKGEYSWMTVTFRMEGNEAIVLAIAHLVS